MRVFLFVDEWSPSRSVARCSRCLFCCHISPSHDVLPVFHMMWPKWERICRFLDCSGCLYVPAYSSVHSFIFFFVYEAKLPVTINREPTYSYWLLPGILQNSKAHGSDCGCGASRGGIDSVCIANNRGDFTHFAFFRCIAPSKASRNVLGDCDKSHFNQVYLIVCNWF